MQISTATLAATEGKPNEDFVGTLPHALVLLDGAGSAGADSGCVHGVAWYSHRLGAEILHALATDHDPQAALRAGITAVADSHRDTCDLAHPGTPSATVVIARLHGDALDYLVLADSVLLLQTPSKVEAISDDREAEVGQRYRTAMDAAPNGTPEHDQALTDYITAMREHRNQRGGFWVASNDPQAADEALTGTVALADLHALALLSDGASRTADRFHLTDWPGLMQTLDDNGPAELLHRTRDAENSDPDGSRWPRGKRHDDATAAYATL